jgi:hypothetical protein
MKSHIPIVFTQDVLNSLTDKQKRIASFMLRERLEKYGERLLTEERIRFILDAVKNIEE